MQMIFNKEQNLQKASSSTSSKNINKNYKTTSHYQKITIFSLKILSMTPAKPTISSPRKSWSFKNTKGWKKINRSLMIGSLSKPREGSETENLNTSTESESPTIKDAMDSQALSNKKLIRNNLHPNKFKATNLTFSIPIYSTKKKHLNITWNPYRIPIT